MKDTSNTATHFVAVERDITEELQLRDQLVHTERLSAVGELVAEKIASIKENISVRRFTRYKMGEGIEKKADDFAAEVASMVG